MNSQRTAQFREKLRTLPKDIRRQALDAYKLFKHDPYHPSLHFKSVNAARTVYSARIGLYYRVLGRRETDDLIVWFWIGTHAEYDKLLGR